MRAKEREIFFQSKSNISTLLEHYNLEMSPGGHSVKRLIAAGMYAQEGEREKEIFFQSWSNVSTSLSLTTCDEPSVVTQLIQNLAELAERKRERASAHKARERGCAIKKET